MSYKEKPQIKIYKYVVSHFVLQAIIDDFAECSFENNRFEAGQFSITINYNIPNALKFERGLWVQFGNNPYAFGEIINITDSIGEDGKGSQIRTITGYDSRYIFKRRIIKNLNNVENWSMTAKGELCMRNLIQDQCGVNAEEKRRLPVINIIPDSSNAIGKVYSVSESFSNLYEVLTTIATQSEIGWRINFDGENLTLEFYEGTDRSLTVRFDTDYESLSNGEFTDSAESFANAIFVGGKGTGNDRDIYEGESAIEGESPSGMDRYEAWDNQSSMTTEAEYEAEAYSMLNQYNQTLEVSGQGLAKCPYEYGKEYNVGDLITISFSGKSAIVQILSVTEHWGWGQYDIEFGFGKPQPDLNKQLQLILRQIQMASNKTTTTDSVRWYTIPTDTTMPKSDVVYNTIGFIGNVGTNATFQLYLDNQKTGAKTYHVWFKQLAGTGKLTLTTGKSGAVNLTMNTGTYVAIISVDENGNIVNVAETPTNTIQEGNNAPVTSGAVDTALGEVETEINTVNNKNNLNEPVYGNVDVFTTIDNCSNTAVSFFRIFEATANSPYGSNSNDFFYYVNKLENDDYLRVMAFDVRSNQIFATSKTGGTWNGWKKVIDESNLLETNILKNGTWGLLGGCNVSNSGTVEDLINNELGVKGGLCGGSIYISTSTKGLPVDWYNFLWIPHRNGLDLDGSHYAKLLLFPFWNADVIYEVMVYDYNGGRYIDNVHVHTSIVADNIYINDIRVPTGDLIYRKFFPSAEDIVNKIESKVSGTWTAVIKRTGASAGLFIRVVNANINFPAYSYDVVILGVLPQGYRPTHEVTFPVMAEGSNFVWYGFIRPDGAIGISQWGCPNQINNAHPTFSVNYILESL